MNIHEVDEHSWFNLNLEYRYEFEVSDRPEEHVPLPKVRMRAFVQEISRRRFQTSQSTNMCNVVENTPQFGAISAYIFGCICSHHATSYLPKYDILSFLWCLHHLHVGCSCLLLGARLHFFRVVFPIFCIMLRTYDKDNLFLKWVRSDWERMHDP
jgi:hypothetical protein